MKKNILEIKNLHANAGKNKILKGVNLTIKSGEIHAVMGKNGSGKSTLCNVLMGHPKYKITKGLVRFNGKNILTLSTDERANLGIFLGFQHPIEILGVTLGNFLRLAKTIKEKSKNTKSEGKIQRINPIEFRKMLKTQLDFLKMNNNFIDRSLNEGFSGGEKKKTEIIQMAILEPKITLLDEIDSGLDIDALKTTAKAIKNYFQIAHPGILLITHYQRILSYITPHFVHIIADGKIIKSGKKDLAKKLEKNGYESFIK